MTAVQTLLTVSCAGSCPAGESPEFLLSGLLYLPVAWAVAASGNFVPCRPSSEHSFAIKLKVGVELFILTFLLVHFVLEPRKFATPCFAKDLEIPFTANG